MSSYSCPDCPPGNIARALVLSEAFWVNFWYTILPFILVGLMVYHLVQHLDRNDRNDDNGEHRDG
jgi:hypothetical protein